PERSIQAWLDKLVHAATLSQAEMQLDIDPQAAEKALREILKDSPHNADAQAMLAEALLKQERFDECRSAIEALEAQAPLDARAQKIKATLDLHGKASLDIEAVRAAAAAEPENWQRQLELAEALAGQQEYVEAFEIGLNLVSRDRKNTGEKARALMVEIFRVLGDDSPLTSEYRRRLASVLY
ncbi:MAG: tetratricopeptide repeat protein, partial [Aureliella sp.]